MDAIRYRLLDEPLLSVCDAVGRRVKSLSLPSLFAALQRDDVGDFPALRPHQRHVWHAFLVQVAALALLRGDLREMPDDADVWRELLLRLTPNDPDGAAWSLVAPHARPAILQSPATTGVSEYKSTSETPDALDMLVTSKNHDVKQRVIHQARPEHWLYALLSLQTQEGFLGYGNYGVSRMNGGFASRPGFGVAVGGGPAARVRRDVGRLLALRARMLEDYQHFPAKGGIALVWLVPWDGAQQLEMSQLDPYYIEICRRVRLVAVGPRLSAIATGSKKARIDAKALAGHTGDPWTPLIPDGGTRKALTADAGDFSYRRLVPLLFPRRSDPKAPYPAMLQEISDTDPDAGLSIVARVVVRGQGRTEGFFERRVLVSKVTRRGFGRDAVSDEPARVAHELVKDVSDFSRTVLYPALMTVFTSSPSRGERARDDDTAKDRVRRALNRFDASVDATFFGDLDTELAMHESGGNVAQHVARARWLATLRDRGRAVLETALASAPSAAMRRYRTSVRARRRFDLAFGRQFGERLTLPQSPLTITGGEQ